MKLFELFGVIDVKDDKVDAKLDNISKKATGLATKMGKLGGQVSSVGSKLVSAGGTMTKFVSGPIAAVGTGLMALNSKTADYGDEIHKASQRMGVSFKSFQELNYWAGQNGVSMTTLEKGVRTLNQQIGEAKSGNDKYNETLEAAGINMEALANGTLSTEDAFAQALVHFSQISDEGERAAAATQLFGSKLAGELMPAISDSSLSLSDAKERAKELGIIMSDDGVNASAAYSDAMDDLKQKIAGVFREISTTLMPVITEKLIPIIENDVIPAIGKFVDKLVSLIEWFSELSPGMQKFIGFALLFLGSIGPVVLAIGGFVSAIGTIITIGGTLVGSFGTMAAAGGIMATAISGAMAIITGPVGIVIGVIAGLVLAGYLLIKNWDKIASFAGTVKDKVVGAFSAIGDFIGSIFTSIWDTIVNNFDNIKKFIGDTLALIWGLITNPVGTLIDIVNKNFGNVGKAITAPIEKAKDAIKKIVEKIKDFFSFKIEFPDVKIPGFNTDKKAKVVKTSKEPKSNTRFFAKGGLMSKPTEFARSNKTSFVGGEAGNEGIVPLQGKHMKPMAIAISEFLKANAKQAASNTTTNINVASLVVREEADIRRIAEELERLTMRKNRLRGAY